MVSSLREKNNKKYRKGINAELPSPKSFIKSGGLAQGQSQVPTWKKKSTVKRISLFMVLSEKTASMTVEAALVLPLFLFFFLNLGSAMEIMRLHGCLETALWEKGREMSVYGSVIRQGVDFLNSDEAEKGTNGIVSQVGELAFSYTFVKAGIVTYVGKDYLDQAPLKGGSDGLHFIGSDLLNENDVIDIDITYQIEAPWMLAAFRSFLMENRYYGRLWTGYEIPYSERGVYFLAENGQVFHTSSSCTHLLLTVRLVSLEEVGKEVNRNGGHYRACEKCVRGQVPEQVWIPKEGDCFHFERRCAGLKRTYRRVEWEEARKYRPCARCSEEREKVKW